jgi:hypothetical protein
MTVTPNKDGNKLEQAYYWLGKALEYEARRLADTTGVATTRMEDMAFNMALKCEWDWYVEEKR